MAFVPQGHATSLNGEGYDSNMYDTIGTAGIGAAAATYTNYKRPRRAKHKYLRDQMGVQTKSALGSVIFANCTMFGPSAKRFIDSELSGKSEPP